MKDYNSWIRSGAHPEGVETGKMEKAITKIIMGLILVAGVFALWILQGRPSSFKSEFKKENNARNAFVLVILLAAAITTIIYINNR